MFRNFWLIGLLYLTGCTSPLFSTTPTKSVATAAPEKLQLVKLRQNACLLLTVSEIESILSIKTSAEPFAFKNGSISCRYAFSTAESPALVTFIYTETSVYQTMEEWFEWQKQYNLEFAAKLGDVTVKDVPELGNKAYYQDGQLLSLIMLKNGIEYEFSTKTLEHGGRGSIPALIALAKIALQRMP
jgi:hypothetical protein